MHAATYIDFNNSGTYAMRGESATHLAADEPMVRDGGDVGYIREEAGMGVRVTGLWTRGAVLGV